MNANDGGIQFTARFARDAENAEKGNLTTNYTNERQIARVNSCLFVFIRGFELLTLFAFIRVHTGHSLSLLIAEGRYQWSAQGCRGREPGPDGAAG